MGMAGAGDSTTSRIASTLSSRSSKSLCAASSCGYSGAGSSASASDSTAITPDGSRVRERHSARKAARNRFVRIVRVLLFRKQIITKRGLRAGGKVGSAHVWRSFFGSEFTDFGYSPSSGPQPTDEAFPRPRALAGNTNSGVERSLRKTLNTAGDQRDNAQADAPNAHGPLANGRTCGYNGGTAQALGSAVLSGGFTLHRGMAGCRPPCPAADCASFLYYTAVFQNMQQAFFGFWGFAPPSDSHSRHRKGRARKRVCLYKTRGRFFRLDQARKTTLISVSLASILPSSREKVVNEKCLH